VGTAYIALFNYVYARQQGGRLILRIEDTDRSRSTEAAERLLLESLAWLGLTYDEGPGVGGPYGPYRQSERGTIYREHIERLLDLGAAYPCFCSVERLAEVRRAQMARKENPGYDGHCRGLSVAKARRRIAAGEPHVIRLRVPDEGEAVWHDPMRGEVRIRYDLSDDQVLIKSDGFPTYHFANVVDDHLMRITHVVRAEEWIPSMPKHLHLYRCFGWEPPVFVHMPLLRNKDRSKISKRKNPTSILFYRRAGILPQALLNFLGLMGWTMPDGREFFTVEEMIEAFSFERVQLGGPVFDREKLIWMNGKYIREHLSEEAIVRHLREEVFSEEYLRRMVPLVRERIDTFDRFVAYGDYFFTGELSYELADFLGKKVDRETVIRVFEALLPRVDALMDWETPEIERIIRGLVGELGVKGAAVFMPIRVAVTGKRATPPLFETMEVLGKEICRWRLRSALEFLRQAGEAGTA
jgi:glutamyl-tRNA synthetase